LKFVALSGIKLLEDSHFTGGADIVLLLLDALIVVAVIVEDQGDFVGLGRSKIQIRAKFLEHGFLRGGSGGSMEDLMEAELHGYGSGGAPGQKYKQESGKDARILPCGALRGGWIS
jgi:hypothetical protein